MTPKARSMKLLREEGWTVGDCERRLPIPGKFVTQDLFGFADLICFNEIAVVLIQVTSASNMAARRKKIQESEAAERWLLCPNRGIVIHGWRKKKERWICNQIEIETAGAIFAA